MVRPGVVVVPVRSTAAMDICIAVPRAGRYAVAVHHDINGNGDKDANDGGAYAGKTVLFLSGSGGSAETYGLQIARYYCVRGADVVAVNYRGFGGSTVDVKGKQKLMDTAGRIDRFNKKYAKAQGTKQ